MSTRSWSGRALLYGMLFFSGASGLVYQVVWHKYLSILLGAHSKATAAVLAIFLGGISLGYWVFGRLTRKPRWNLLTAYAVVEVGLTLWAFSFPYLFDLAMAVAPGLYQMLGLENPLIDIVLSICLIGFPTFLMGGTLPLLTQGMAIDVKEASQTHARIYGFNTVGACFGCLIAGYVLIPIFGLGVSSTLAGLINGLVAFVAYFAFAKYWTAEFEVVPDTGAPIEDKAGNLGLALLFGVGFLSGFYVLSLETVFIRLMGLATGSSNYTFTLVVSIFVFGLGFGSLLVRRISSYREGHLFWCQVGVAGALLALYHTADQWPYYVHLVRITFASTPFNYPLFQIALAGLFATLFLVPVGLCGLILPLCFHLVKDRADNLGYRVGQLYGLNTVGAVLGSILGGYFLLAYIDLDDLFKFCIGLSLLSAGLSGYLYLRRQQPKALYRGLGGVAVGTVALFLLLSPSLKKDIYLQPFRIQEPINQAEWPSYKEFYEHVAGRARYLMYKDGPNSTVGVGADASSDGVEKSRTVFMNGKSDGNTIGDSYTMLLTGHLPALFSRNLERSCVIGFGTGMSIGALALYDNEIEKVDVVEISETLKKNAHFFDPFNGNVSTNPKVDIHVMDAFRFLEGTTQLYGTIISEPSNPWVVGVENLYSSEFYQIAKKKLIPGGIYVQWLQTYSFNNELFEMVLKTISSNFKHVMVYQMMGSDWALIASDEPFGVADVERAKQRMANSPRAATQLKNLGHERIESILALEMIPQGASNVISERAEPLHLGFPRLSNGAAKARFVQFQADVEMVRRRVKEFYPLVKNALIRQWLDGKNPSREVVESWRQTFCHHPKAENVRLCKEALLAYRLLYPSQEFAGREAVTLRKAKYENVDSFRTGLRKPASGSFTRDDLTEIGQKFGFFKIHHSPVSFLPFEALMKPVEYCLKTKKGTAGALYGECLLQKVALHEVMSPDSEGFRGGIDEYVRWIDALPKDTENYSHYKEAGEILVRIKNGLPVPAS